VRRFLVVAAIAITLVFGRSAHAEPSVFLARALPASFELAPNRSTFTLVRVAPGSDATGLRSIAPGIAVFEGDAAAMRAYANDHPNVGFELHPPLRAKLDVALPFVGVKPIGGARDLDGRGTFVGIVDTGVDISHRAFRNEDGSTRIAWFLDYATAKRPGIELDEKYGGRVYDRAEINAIINGMMTIANPPGDRDGHGTHVAGIAAGDGGSGKMFFGLAPAAELIVVRASDAQGGVDEGKAVLGAEFVFDRAAAEGRPAVVNLSLGTQYGAHDGTSAFEEGLSAAAKGRGRAVVVAASNEGHLPIHTSVRISPGDPYRIPIRMRGRDGKGAPYTDAQVFIWINARDRGDLKVSVRRNGDPWIAPVERGHAVQSKPIDNVTLFVGNEDRRALESEATSGAVVVLTGPLPIGDFELELEGDTAAEIWLQGARQAIDGPGMPLFLRGGQIEGSIGVPASTYGVISVGSVDTRTSFVNRKRQRLVIDDAVIGTRSYFSSSGPAANGVMRPDFLAPGHYVISTLARSAALAEDEDLIVDSEYSVLSGTSMSAPFATGAIALLFQRDPTLTQEDVRALLQAGARRLADDPIEGGAPRDYAMGAGILDVEGALLALDRKTAAPTATSLFLRLGSSYLAADGGLPVSGLVLARDAEGRPADVEGGLGLMLANATIHTPFEHPAVGLYRFAIKAIPGRAGEDATIAVRGRLSLTRTIPIGADRWDARDGVGARGGCSMSASETSPAALALVALMFLRRSRARRRVPATAARRDGTA